MTKQPTMTQKKGLFEARSQEELHFASYEILKARLDQALEGEEVPPSEGVCFLVVGEDQDMMIEGLVAPLIGAQGAAWVEMPARMKDTGKVVRVILAGWLSQAGYRTHLALMPVPHGWLSHKSFIGEEAPRVLLERVGVMLNQPVLWDIFDSLPRQQTFRDFEECLEPPFDYSQDPGEPGDPTELCYTRCTWGVSTLNRLVLEREPGSCWEGHHNALLQAAAPRMFRALRSVAAGDSSALAGIQGILETLRDPDWVDFVANSERWVDGVTPRRVLEEARGLKPGLHNGSAL
jgi:hypothetical protein